MSKIYLRGRVGEIHHSKKYGDLVIESIVDSRNVFVKFLRTGYTTRCSYSNILADKVKDKLCPSIFNWGVNDVEDTTWCPVDNSKRCQIYVRWKGMLRRCYDVKYQENTPSYVGCSVCEEWKYFSNFRRWVLEEQPNKDWMNCHLDKDLLILHNKVYSPLNCVYITDKLNCFMLDNKKNRGNYLIGVSYYKKLDCYRADCNNPFNINTNFIGYFGSELEAHKAWQAKKHEYALSLAEEQDDPRVAKALRERYAPDKDWTNI